MKTKAIISIRKKKSLGKEVKGMKRLCALITAIFFLTSGVNAFAVTTTKGTTIESVTYYNPEGVATSSQSTRTSTTVSTGEGGTSTTTTVQKSWSEWKGGSLKVTAADGDATTNSSDSSTSNTHFWTTYSYNGSGQLNSATGGSDTQGNNGDDANGDPIGSFHSWATDTYNIRNGQALRVSSVSNGDEFGPDGTKTSTTNTTTSYAYNFSGGSWALTQETSTSTSDNVNDAGYQTMTRIKTYQRDANGVLTGITQTSSGTRADVDPDTKGLKTMVLNNYSAQFYWDAEEGWYIGQENITWAVPK